jgi:uncharacterized membrane protein YfcA
MPVDPWIIVFGLGVGILVGMTGMGGGSLMTPLLILVFGVAPVTAIGTDLAYGAVTKSVGGWRHWRQGTVDFRVSAWLAAGSVPGALAGVWALGRLQAAFPETFDTVVLTMVAVAVLLTGAIVYGRAVLDRRAAERERTHAVLGRWGKAAAVSFGLVIGFVLGVTSAGSGALIGLVLILAFRLTPHRVVGTDVFHAAVLLWVAGLAHVVSGNVDFVLAGTILLGSIPGVLIGTRLSVRLSAAGLRPALGVVLLASGLGLLTKAGVAIPPALLVAAPLGLAALAVAAHLARTRVRTRVLAVEPA